MPPVDHAQRERALDPSRSFIVKAPAGSGKTELLIQRYLRLLAGVERPESVVAITFTKKAAAEMQRRVLGALEDARKDAPQQDHAKRTWRLAREVLERSAQRGWDLAHNPRRLSIRTIDSLCSSLVNRMPWLSRLGPRLEILEKADDLYREAARRTLELIEEEEYAEPIGRLWRHLDNNQARLTKLLAEMLARRDQWLRHVVDSGERARLREGYEGMLRHRVRAQLERLVDAAPAFLAERLPELARYAAAHLADPERYPGILGCHDMTELPGSAEEDLARWQGLAELLLTNQGGVRARADKAIGFPPQSGRRKQDMANLLVELKDAPEVQEQLAKVRSLPAPRFDDDQWRILEAMLVALRAAAGQLRLVFGERGQVDFAALTEAALAALGEDELPTDLALALDGRVEHLLVDEFQDTSHSQMRLLERLTVGWTPGDGRTVFLVGDPMQSIYRFREAEVGLFLRTVARGLPSVEIQPLELTVNFRSRSNIVAWVNEKLPGVFAEREDIELGAVRFSPSDCASDEPSGLGVQVHPFFYADGAAEEGQPAAEAERVREIVERARSEGKSVAVLARARTHLPRILSGLRGAGVAYQAVEIDPLGASPPVRDLFALTSALLHPGDSASWLAILRAPWCGLTLPDLHGLTHDQTRAAVPALLAQSERLAGLSREGRVRVERLLAALDAPRPRAIRAWVEGVWLRLGGPATASTAAGLDDAEAFFDLLEKLDRGCDVDLDLLRLHIEDLYAAPDPSASGGVQVMTIHKAKGLEFDVVILPGLARSAASDGDRLLLWLESPSEEGFSQGDVLLAPIKPVSARSNAVYDWVRRLEAEKQKQEESRLLYVAATRARSELHLMGAVKVKDGKIHKPGRGTLLHRLWEAAGPHFDASDWSAAAPAEETVRPPLAVRRLVADWQSPVAPRPPGEAAMAREQEFSTRYRWAAQRRRLVGTVVHGLLQEIGREGAASWGAERLRGARRRYEALLGLAGLAGAELAKASAEVERAVLSALEDERGRWILDNGHKEARSEVSLAGVVDGRVVERRVDRTFLDKDGVRWVIDFKTSASPKGDIEAFLAVQMERYRRQMEDYRALYRRLEGRRVRIGLYFPLVPAWREYEETAGAAAV
jgi:ATP-dependent exoDNAse (exonuclease V) beta subunit